MWANFGPAVQVKHLTLNPKKANEIIDQIESDHIVVVCETIEEKSIATLLQQITWKNRVRGIVTEKDLIQWYERCLREKYREQLAKVLMETLLNGFIAEFPQAVPSQTAETAKFLKSRHYNEMDVPPLWDAHTKEDIVPSKKRERKSRKPTALG